jgi:hypothetical protein
VSSVGACVLAGLLVALPTVPAVAANPADPCGGFSLTPPDAYIDPKCIEDSTGDDFDVNPVLQGDSVFVSWTFHGDNADEVDNFVILRGPTPATLSLVDFVDATEENEYVDDRGLKGQSDLWYAVGAHYENGDYQQSAAHLVQLETN